MSSSTGRSSKSSAGSLKKIEVRGTAKRRLARAVFIIWTCLSRKYPTAACPVLIQHIENAPTKNRWGIF